MNTAVLGYLRRFSVRVRIWAAILLLAGVLVISIFLLITGPANVGGLARQSGQAWALEMASVDQLNETERSLLAASARIAASQGNLLAYAGELVPGPDDSLLAASQALLHLDIAAAAVPADTTVMISPSGAEVDAGSPEIAVGAARELEAEIRDLRLNLASYQALVEQSHNARLAGDRRDALQTLAQARAAAEALDMTAERLAVDTGIARAAAESRLEARAQARTISTVVGYGVGGVLSLGLAFVLVRSVTTSVNALRLGAERLSAVSGGGSMPAPIPAQGEDELADVAGALNTLSANLARAYQVLDSRVIERTAGLNTRVRQLQAVLEVVQAAASATTELPVLGDAVNPVIELDVLLQQIVDVIRRRLSLYYVGLFLVDDASAGETDVMRHGNIALRAGTGEAGARMVARGHRLSPGEGMIGWAIANGQARVALQAETDLVRVINPDLPATRSEAAIPLRLNAMVEDSADTAAGQPIEGRLGGAERRLVSQSSIIGALTVQDDAPDAFDEETVELLQAMADLLAVMIENVRRYRDVRAALETAHRSYGQDAREGWKRVLGRQSTGTGYRTTELGALAPASGSWDDRMRQAMAEQQIVEVAGGLIVPITARGQTIGALRLQRTTAVRGSETGSATEGPSAPPAVSQERRTLERGWSSKEVGLVRTIVEQLGLALDSARLYEDTQISAARERTAREVTDRMRGTLDWDELMQTAIREIGRAVDASHVYVEWAPPQAGEAVRSRAVTATAEDEG